jgi:DNA-binding CsgD family transcriptional regulator
MRGGDSALLERSADLEAISAAIQRASDGMGACVLIEGEAGIGKTELLRAARQIAADVGLTVLTARASELERDYAYGVTRQLFQAPLTDLNSDERAQALSGAASLAASLLDTGDETPADTPPADGFALLHGLHWLCANLALRRPLMLGVDDVQWADLGSLRFLHYLAGRIEELPVVVIATLRTGEPDAPEELFAQLRAEEATERLRPSALSLDATMTFLRDQVSTDAEPAFCAACHRATGGNPLLLWEMTRALALEGVPPTAAEADRIAEIGGRGLAEGVLSRIDRLAGGASAVARAVAILEPHATLRRVAAAARVRPDVASASAHALVEAGVLRDGSPLAFNHPLLRSAAESAMTDPQKQDLHAAAARVHRDESGDPELIAAHLVKTQTLTEPWLVETLRAAAQKALSRGAPDPAVSYLHRALDETIPDHERPSLMRLLGSALLRAGDEDGIAWMKRAREASDDPEFRAAIAEEVGPSLIVRMRFEEATALVQGSIVDLAGASSETELLLRAAIVRTALGGNQDAFGEPYQELKRAARGARGGSFEERMAHQFLALGAALGLATAPEARNHALIALDDEDAVRASAASGGPLGQAALALAICGEPALALRMSEIGTEEMRRRAALFGIASNLSEQAATRLTRGDIAGAAMDAEEAHQLAAQGIPMVPAGVAGIRVAIAIERGLPADAEQILIDGGLTGKLPSGLFIGFTQVARARLRLLQGRIEEALADLTIAAGTYHGLGTVGPDLTPPRLHVPLALFALGRVGEARDKAESEEGWARQIENPRLIGEALRVRGLVDDRVGIDALREAVGVLAPTDYRLDHARALVDLCAALLRAKERKASRDPLRQAMDLAHRCGATALEDRARIELEATGARPRSVLVSGAESLTPSELRVAKLAAGGMTNREIAQSLFVAPKTVETHLRHCYQKLEIAGRSGLVDALPTDG